MSDSHSEPSALRNYLPLVGRCDIAESYFHKPFVFQINTASCCSTEIKPPESIESGPYWSTEDLAHLEPYM